ncbi:hypothetical protein [uncultured Massilia sp.]|uniref:hypothetical protein n=1 Tax=uncultured Massilia sp. TaxID=169973 RepID=UPI0025FD1071|nr:hypothetical protein [uncultured Massilia sp.]
MQQLTITPHHDQPARPAGWRMRPAARRRRLERLRLQRALAYIEAHLDGRLDVTTLARHCGLGAGRFASAFAAFVGIPLQRYVAHKRLERARLLLLAHALPLPGIVLAPFPDEAALAAAAVRAASAPIGADGADR